MLSPGNVAVHHVGTRVFLTFHQRWEEGGLVDVEQQESKHHLHHYLKQQAEEVGPPKTSSLLPCVVIQEGGCFLRASADVYVHNPSCRTREA